MVALIEKSILRNSWVQRIKQSAFICFKLTWYEAILFLQVGVEYFQGVLVKTEINYLQAAL